MRRGVGWILMGTVAAVALAAWGMWTWRLGAAHREVALALEAERQRSFLNMVYHVEQIQTLLGKGLAAGSIGQNMRYMGDVHHHAQSAVSNFTRLPMDPEMGASTGKFLQQTGDFALSLLRNEAAGRPMDRTTREELARLRQHAEQLSSQLQSIAAQYVQGAFRWVPPMQMNTATLLNGYTWVGKPATGDQPPSSLVPGGWDKVGAAMGKLPVLLYDGPFSDHVAKRAPALSGPPVTQEEATGRMNNYIPNSGQFQVVGVTEVGGTIEAYSFRLAPRGTGTPAGTTPAYTTSAEITKNGGHLLQFINGRMLGQPTIDLNRAKQLGERYLTSVGYQNMQASYGVVTDGSATIAYVLHDNGVVVYPDQIKVKVALDNGEVLGVDARQYVMSHHARTYRKPQVTLEEAQDSVNPDLTIRRTQLALIPNLAGTGEILTYEFLTSLGDETFLVYINAETGIEEQILQQLETDQGTLTL